LKSYGQIGYEAYCAHTNGKSLITGSVLPTWDKLMPHIREAWEAAGAAIYQQAARSMATSK
jgi:hypothetical protein